MWKCIRCEKENLDIAESCEECGHAKTIDYIHYRTLSKISTIMADSWKTDQNSPEYLVKQGKQHLQKAVEAFERANVNKIDKTTRELIVRLNNCFGEEEINKANSKMQTESQETTPVVKGRFMDSGVTDFLPHELVESRKKTLQIFNIEELKKRRYDRNYQGNSIEKICGKFLSYEENQNMNTIQKDRMINTLKIASEDKIYFIHDDSLFQRGKNGFAITDKGIYICETFDTERFVPWKEFKEYEIINSKTGCVEAGQSGDCRVIAYIAGIERRLQVEMLLIEIHKFLNQ